MSDFDRNYRGARGGFADRAVAIDAGLRAYMIRVYNYMAGAVALTGVVAWLTFSRRSSTRRAGHDHRPDVVRPDDLQRPADRAACSRTLGLVFFISFRINRLQYRHGAGAVHASTPALLGVSLSSIFLVYTGAVDHAGVLHLGGDVRRA